MATNEMYRQLLSQAVHNNGSGNQYGSALIGGRVNTYGKIYVPSAKAKAKRPPKGPPTQGYAGVQFVKGEIPKGTIRGTVNVTISPQEAVRRYNSRLLTYKVNDDALSAMVQGRIAAKNAALPAGAKPHTRVSGEELAILKYRARAGTKNARRELKAQGVGTITEQMLLDPNLRGKAKGERRVMSQAEKNERQTARNAIASQPMTAAQRSATLQRAYDDIAKRYARGGRPIPVAYPASEMKFPSEGVEI